MSQSEKDRLAAAKLNPKTYPIRTGQQNKALHVLFQLMADTLNDNGLDMKKAFARKPEVEIPWSGHSIKEYLWRPIQKAQLNKDSTTKLTTVEIDEVFETINKFIGEAFGLHVPFPSIKEIIWQQEQERAERERVERVKKSRSDAE